MKKILSFAFILGALSAGPACGQDYYFIDIKQAANRGFTDDIENDKKGGWTDFGSASCIKNIPYGQQVFQDSLIPFQVIDPAENNGKSVVVLQGPERMDRFPGNSGKIIVNKNLDALFFLHTSMYAKSGEHPLALVNYRIHYQDGTEKLFECMKGREIDDWWDPPEFLPGAVRTYNESKKWLINTPWKNPHPDKTIAWIQMESTGNAIPILAAVTGSHDPEEYNALTAFIDKRIKQYELSNLKIAMLQIRSQPDQQWNLKKGIAFCKLAHEKGADIAVFPEMYNIGYHAIDFDQPNAIEKWKDRAISKESNFVKTFQGLAKKYEMAIVVTYLEDIGNDKLPRNVATLIDRHGKIVFTYAKVHTCDFANMENACTPGDGFIVKPLDTKAGPVNIGMMICYDREHPESARLLMLEGAEIILTPNACRLEALRLNQFQTRAYENAVAMVMANYGYATDNKRFNGRSCIYDANADEVIVAPGEEGVYTGTINIHDIRNYRKETIWGNAFRRPHKYDKLISPEVDDVFKRNDSFGDEFKRLER